VFLPALIRALRFELQQFRTESWYAAMLAQLMDLPSFRQHWLMVKREPPPTGPARARALIRLNVPGADTLQFRLSAETFVRDTRFRMIFYLPADPATMQQCAVWASGAGSA
jgi:hypothetical protein